jgi:hypothetical protein
MPLLTEITRHGQVDLVCSVDSELCVCLMVTARTEHVIRCQTLLRYVSVASLKYYDSGGPGIARLLLVVARVHAQLPGPLVALITTMPRAGLMRRP